MAKENAKVVSDVSSLRDQLRSLHKRVDGTADKTSVETLGDDVEGFKRQLHGRMLSLSSVQSSQGKTVEKLQDDLGKLAQAAGSLTGTVQEVARLGRGFDSTEARLKGVEVDLAALGVEIKSARLPPCHPPTRQYLQLIGFGFLVQGYLGAAARGVGQPDAWCGGGRGGAAEGPHGAGGADRAAGQAQAGGGAADGGQEPHGHGAGAPTFPRCLRSCSRPQRSTPGTFAEPCNPTVMWH